MHVFISPMHGQRLGCASLHMARQLSHPSRAFIVLTRFLHLRIICASYRAFVHALYVYICIAHCCAQLRLGVEGLPG